MSKIEYISTESLYISKQSVTEEISWLATHSPSTDSLKNKHEKALSIFNDIVHGYPFHIVGWYGIMRCYEKMSQEEKASAIREKIYHLIENDKRSTEMFQKYGDLMEGFEPVDSANGGKDKGLMESESPDNELRQRKNVAHPEPFIPDLGNS